MLGAGTTTSAAKWLDPDEGWPSCPVLRGRRCSDAPLLPDIGVDAASGLVHTVVGTGGNVSDVTQAHALLHGDEVAAFGDAGYQGVEKRAEDAGKPVAWHVAMKRGKRRALPQNKLGRVIEKLEHLKASVRAKVEHPLHVIKNLFRLRKTRYRGLATNTAQLFTLFGFANLMLVGRRFTVTETRSAS